MTPCSSGRHPLYLSPCRTKRNEVEPLRRPAWQPVLERVNRLPAIGPNRAVEPVVQQHDVACRNCLQTLDQRSKRLRGPVPGTFRPHDWRIETQSSYRRMYLRPAIPIWWTHDRRAVSGCLHDGSGAALQFVHNVCSWQPQQVGMRVGVIPDRVASVHNLRRQVRARPHVTANQEECRTSLVLIQQIEQQRCHCRVWSIIERQGERPVSSCSSARRSEQLRGWMAGAPCTDPRRDRDPEESRPNGYRHFLLDCMSFRRATPRTA